MANVQCHSVKVGEHHSLSPTKFPSNNKPVVSTWVKFDKNCAQYIYPSNDTRGYDAALATNKLWGIERCGPNSHVHRDSDRFVWRRSPRCLKLQKPFVLGEVQNCVEKDLIEIYAYTYDNGSVPYHAENVGKLHKTFKNKLRVETWYLLKLTALTEKTIFEIFDEENTLIESTSTDHRDCGTATAIGKFQTLYFG